MQIDINRFIQAIEYTNDALMSAEVSEEQKQYVTNLLIQGMRNEKLVFTGKYPKELNDVALDD